MNDVVKLAEDAHPELSDLTEWMRVNKLIINLKKTESMVIRHLPKRKLQICQKILKLHNTLGVIVDETLIWEEHFKWTKDKMGGGLAALKQTNKISFYSFDCVIYIMH